MADGFLVQRSDGKFVQRSIQLIFVWQLVVAPFVDDDSFLQQYQPRIGTDNCFQGNFVCQGKRIFGTCVVLPDSNVLIWRSCQAEEAVSVFYTVVIYFVYQVNAAVVCLFQIRSYQQERIIFVVQYCICQVCSVFLRDDGEIVNRRFIPFSLIRVLESTNVHVESEGKLSMVNSFSTPFLA